MSLAIGKKGQNVRLAARLTGYKIDIRPESEVEFVDEKSSDSDSEDAAATNESQDVATTEETTSSDGTEAADANDAENAEDNTEE